MVNDASLVYRERLVSLVGRLNAESEYDPDYIRDRGRALERLENNFDSSWHMNLRNWLMCLGLDNCKEGEQIKREESITDFKRGVERYKKKIIERCKDLVTCARNYDVLWENIVSEHPENAGHYYPGTLGDFMELRIYLGKPKLGWLPELDEDEYKPAFECLAETTKKVTEAAAKYIEREIKKEGIEVAFELPEFGRLVNTMEKLFGYCEGAGLIEKELDFDRKSMNLAKDFLSKMK